MYFLLAYLVNKFLELVVLGSGFLKSLLSFFGVQVPTTIPQWAADFYTNGYQGIKFWDLVKFIAIVLVGWEAIRYWQANEALGGKASPLTLGIFAVILSLLALTTIPELLQRLKDVWAMNQTATDTGGAAVV